MLVKIFWKLVQALVDLQGVCCKTVNLIYIQLILQKPFTNYKNNKNYINNSNLFLVKSSVYNMPFNNNTFDKVICLGVLQHTPDVQKTIKCLIDKSKIGEIILDFYPLKGW